jgi:hypothetical protein
VHFIDADVGSEITRIDDGNLHPVVRNFGTESFDETIERKLRCAVIGQIRKPNYATNGANERNLAGTLPPHDGKHSFDGADGPEKVDVKELLCLVDGRVFQRAHQTSAGCGHQSINTTFAGKYGGHRLGDRCIVRHIER